jgi:hypothetical protein
LGCDKWFDKLTTNGLTEQFCDLASVGRMSAALSALHVLPVEIELAVRSRAIPQIQIDQALVSDAYFFRDRLD